MNSDLGESISKKINFIIINYMGFKSGIIGLPNVGKSTLFNILTNSKVKAENFPFCTIDPNAAIVPLRDKKLQKLADLNKSKKIIYSSLEFVDIAGLVKGASQGEGLGNRFLGHISTVDLIIHVIRCFEDEGITHVMNRIDPLEDFKIIRAELNIADLNKIEGMKKKMKTDKKILALLEEAEKKLQNDEKMEIEDPSLQFLSFKPMIVLANGENHENLAVYCKEKNIPFCSFSIGLMEEYKSLLEDSDELGEFLKDLDSLVEMGFKELDLISFFTVGPQEAHAWTLKNGTRAQDAAGKIHSSFVKHFIAAEVIDCESYLQGNRNYRLEGKDYIVKDKDIINFRTTA